jgi:hypothetical protein
VTFEAPRRPFRLLGCALGISLVLAFPMERLIHEKHLWGLGSCGAGVQIALNLGAIVQAILTPLLLFLLPGPGSIFQPRVVRKPPPLSRPPVFFLSAALLFASTIPLVWWFGFRRYSAFHNTCGDLFDLGRPVDIYHVDYFADFAHYFIYLSAFSAFWVGVTAGGLRLLSARAAAPTVRTTSVDSRIFTGHACSVGRFNIVLASGASSHSQEDRPSG